MKTEIITVPLLEMESQLGDAGKFEQMLACRRSVDHLMLQYPGKVVRNEDRIESGGQRRIDVRARAVSDHPSRRRFAGVVRDQVGICSYVFLGQHLNCSKMRLKPRALEFAGLFLQIALGYQDDAMVRSQLDQRFGDSRQQLDLVISDGLGEAGDALMLLRCHRGIGKLLKAVHQRAAKAVQPIAVGRNGGMLAVVQVFAHLLRSMDTVVQVGDKAGDGPLKVDIVLPQRVIGVEEQRLGCCTTRGGFK